MNRPTTFSLRSVTAAFVLCLSLPAIGQINCSDARASLRDEKSVSGEGHFDGVMAALWLEDEAGVLPEKQAAFENFAAPDDFVPVDFVSGKLPLLAARNCVAHGHGSVFLRPSGSDPREHAQINAIATLLPGFSGTPANLTVSPAFASGAQLRFISRTNPAAAEPLDAAELVSAFPSTLRTVCQGKAGRLASPVQTAETSGL